MTTDTITKARSMPWTEIWKYGKKAILLLLVIDVVYRILYINKHEVKNSYVTTNHYNTHHYTIVPPSDNDNNEPQPVTEMMSAVMDGSIQEQQQPSAEQNLQNFHIPQVSPFIDSQQQLNVDFSPPKQQSEEEKVQTTYSDPGTLIAVINTAKMATGSLTRTFLKAWNCKDQMKQPDGLHINKCTDDRTVMQTHRYNTGAKGIVEYRKEYPDKSQKCLVTSAIRSPQTWFQSQYLQRKDGCKAASMTVDEMFHDYKQFISTFNIEGAFHSCLPSLMREFNGGTLVEQMKIMDETGGYSILGPAPSTSALAGCELLFLRVEDGKKWDEFIHKLVPDNPNYKNGISRKTQCPELKDHIQMLESYEMTDEEKKSLYQRGGKHVQDWFNAYNFL